MAMPERLLGYVGKISDILGRQCKFGIYDEDDIRQEIFILVNEGQRSYDPEKGDEFSFYFHFVKNRLKTLKRDNYFNATIADTDSMRRINNAQQIGEDSKSYINTDLDAIDRDELLLEVVGSKIPANLRMNYLKMLEGVALSYHERVRLINTVRNIIGVNNGQV